MWSHISPAATRVANHFWTTVLALCTDLLQVGVPAPAGAAEGRRESPDLPPDPGHMVALCSRCEEECRGNREPADVWGAASCEEDGGRTCPVAAPRSSEPLHHLVCRWRCVLSGGRLISGSQLESGLSARFLFLEACPQRGHLCHTHKHLKEKSIISEVVTRLTSRNSEHLTERVLVNVSVLYLQKHVRGEISRQSFASLCTGAKNLWLSWFHTKEKQLFLHNSFI